MRSRVGAVRCMDHRPSHPRRFTIDKSRWTSTERYNSSTSSSNSNKGNISTIIEQHITRQCNIISTSTHKANQYKLSSSLLLRSRTSSRSWTCVYWNRYYNVLLNVLSWTECIADCLRTPQQVYNVKHLSCSMFFSFAPSTPFVNMSTEIFPIISRTEHFRALSFPGHCWKNAHQQAQGKKFACSAHHQSSSTKRHLIFVFAFTHAQKSSSPPQHHPPHHTKKINQKKIIITNNNNNASR